MRNEVVAASVILLVIASAGVGYFVGTSSERTTTSVSTTTLTTTYCGPFGCDISTTTVKSGQTSLDTTFTTNLYYQISINYSGSWNLVYWGTNGTITPSNFTNYNVKGNLNGSGNYETTIVTYTVGYGENTLCAKATRLDSQPTLTLTMLNSPHFTNNTTASNPSAEVCATFGV
jgi:hypothetical protein